jgi:hypothetical protein
MPTSTVLQQALQYASSGVTQSAIKVMPYGTIESLMDNAGPLDAGDPSWTPVPTSADVDVVMLAGNNIQDTLVSTTENTDLSWIIEIVNPINGVPIEIHGMPTSLGGSLPSFWNSLPDDG